MVYPGEVRHGKGVGDLIEAVLRLNRSGHAVRLTICGDGPDRDALQGASGSSLAPDHLPGQSVQRAGPAPDAGGDSCVRPDPEGIV